MATEIPGQLTHPTRHDERLKAAKLHAQAILSTDATSANTIAEQIVGAYFNPQAAAEAREEH